MTIKLPDLGEGATSGTVVTILVQKGDTIKKDQPIIELENEKAVAAIPASAAGEVEDIHVSEGDEISIGDAILTISEAKEPDDDEGESEEKEEKEGKKDSKKESKEKRESQSEKEESDGAEEGEKERGQQGSPTVRMMASQLGIDLAKVPPGRRGGRVTVEDLRDYVQGLMQAAARPPDPPAPGPVDFSKWGPIYKRPLTPTRRAISRAMTRVNSEVPQVTQFAEADITALFEFMATHRSAYEAQGLRLTLTVVLLGALVPVLKKFPVFNASFNAGQNEIIIKEYFHVGIAVDTPKGLYVPVIRDVDRKTPSRLARELQELGEKASEGKLTSEDMHGGSFTISNQGGIGGGHFTPLVNLPDTAILGLGRARKQPHVIENDNIAPRMVLPLSLSYDHRVIDGADAVRFIMRLVEDLERYEGESLKLTESS